MDAALVNGFIGSAQRVLQSEVGEPINIGQVAVQTVPYTSQDVTTIIGVTGSVEGVLMFGLSESTAKQIVSHMMGQEVETFDELAQSGIAELGNVIAGTAVTELADNGHVCTIAPPTLIIGRGTTISTVDIKRLVIPLVTSCGMVEMQVALKFNGHKTMPTVAKTAVMR